MTLEFGDDFVAWTKRVKEKESMDAEMVFVGYGVVAPEYNWDDYKNVDVRGKVIVMLINDPPIPDPNDPSKLDAKMFGGRAMTYYGRWTYKFEIAAAKGAAGALIVHETEPASYGWDVSRTATRKSISISWRRITTCRAWPSKAGSRTTNARAFVGCRARFRRAQARGHPPRLQAGRRSARARASRCKTRYAASNRTTS